MAKFDSRFHSDKSVRMHDVPVIGAHEEEHPHSGPLATLRQKAVSPNDKVLLEIFEFGNGSEIVTYFSVYGHTIVFSIEEVLDVLIKKQFLEDARMLLDSSVSGHEPLSATVKNAYRSGISSAAEPEVVLSQTKSLSQRMLGKLGLF